MAEGLYTSENSEYLKNNSSWHVGDSPWKAGQIFKMIKRNELELKSVVEVGCGAGEVLVQLQLLLNDQHIKYEGYDISPDAFELSKGRANKQLKFFNEDLLVKNNVFFDLCLIIDVIEHVDNYVDFIKQCGNKATFKMYHIPIDLHVNSLLRNYPIKAKNQVGHIHFFTKDTALAAVSDSGQEIIDYFYTPASIARPRTVKGKFLNLFRRALYKMNPDFCNTLLGGYSLMVLAK